MNNIQAIQPTFKAYTPIKTKQRATKITETFQKTVQEKALTLYKRPKIWSIVDNFVKGKIEKLKQSKFSSDPRVRSIEFNLHHQGVEVRFNDDLDLAKFFEKGVETLQDKGIECPKNFFFVTPKIKKLGIMGATYNLIEDPKESPVILTKDIAEKASETKNLYEKGITSTDNPYHTFFHETGHWLLFKNQYDKEKSCQIFEKEADKEVIAKEVSRMCITTNDGSEFCTEYFAAKMAGKDFTEEIENLAKKLNAPLAK